jgi:hypothetical protein
MDWRRVVTDDANETDLRSLDGTNGAWCAVDAQVGGIVRLLLASAPAPIPPSVVRSLRSPSKKCRASQAYSK